MKPRGRDKLRGSRLQTKRAAAECLARPYSRILIPQEDGRFSAEVLEFPGCFAEGDSPEAAYANLEAAAESWLLACIEAGTPVPPPLTNFKVSGRFALRLPRSLYLRAAKAAAREGISLNQYVTMAVAESASGAPRRGWATWAKRLVQETKGGRGLGRCEKDRR